MSAHAMVVATVFECDGDPHESFSGAQLERGTHLDVDGTLTRLRRIEAFRAGVARRDEQ